MTTSEPMGRLAFGLVAMTFASLVACEPPAPTTSLTVELPPRQPPQPSSVPSAATEGTRLAGIAKPAFHACEGALFVTADASTAREQVVTIYLVHGDELVLQESHALRFARASEARAELMGRWPDAIYADVRTRDDEGFHARMLRRTDAGWVDLALVDFPYYATWWGDGLMGLMRDPAVSLGRRLVRIDAPGSELPLPVGEGPACDARYATPGFPKLAVQPLGVSSAAGELFLLGVGCDGMVAAAVWSPGTAAARVQALGERAFYDGLPGRVLGRSAADLWFFRPPMRPAALSALRHFDGTRWSNVALPGDDVDLDGAAVDGYGALWAVIDGKLFRRWAERWLEQPLSKPCEVRGVATVDKDSVWVACPSSVERITARPPR